jgi:hypothetical protein
VITDQVKFFYSTNGTDVQGPVTEEGLRLLVQTKVLGPESFILREGESEWKPCTLAPAERPVTSMEPYNPPAYVPTPEALERMKMPEDEGPLPEVLTGVYVVLAVAGSGLLSLMNAQVADTPQTILYRAGAFLGHLVFIALLPFVVSLLFRLPLRNLIRVAGAAAACALLYVVHVRTQILHEQAAAVVSSQQTNAAAATKMTSQSFMQDLKASASGETPEAKIAKDLLTYQDNLMAKVRASQTAEKLCNVDPTTITGVPDIEDRIANLSKLHDAQGEVIAYLKSYNDNCHKIMAADKFDPSMVFAAVEKSRKATHVDLLISLWKANQRLTDDHAARLKFLEAANGQWSVEGGKLLFQKDVNLKVYDAYNDTLNTDVKLIADVQKQIAEG